MNKFVKPRLTIQLKQQKVIDLAKGVALSKEPDYWQVTVVMGTSEGQRNVEKFCAMAKEDALRKAYVFVSKALEYQVLDKSGIELKEELKRQAFLEIPEEDERHQQPIPEQKPVKPWKWWNWFYNPID